MEAATSDVLVQLFRYNRWVDEILFTMASQLEASGSASNEAMAAVLASAQHIVDGEVYYSSYWMSRDPAPEPGNTRSMGELISMWESLQQELHSFVDASKNRGLAEEVDFRNRDLVWRLPIGHLVANIVNHGTHHRSELAAMLTAAGMSPPPLDFVDFLYEQRRAEAPGA